MRKIAACCPWLTGSTSLLCLLATAVFLLDRASKDLIVGLIPYGGSIAVVDGFFSLAHTRNTGVAFSMLADTAPWFRSFVLPALQVAIVVVILVLFFKAKSKDLLCRFALALLLGGAVGNLSDRLVHGYVTDFLDVYLGSYHWPTFNVADSAITVGAILLILESIRTSRVVREVEKSA